MKEFNTLIKALGYSSPTAIQEMVYSPIVEGKDVIGISPTGTGKTIAYALSALQYFKQVKKSKPRYCSVLVLVPSRELAKQVYNVFVDVVKKTDSHAKIRVIYGGESINLQMQHLAQVDVAIATPGRLLDLIENNALHLGETRTIIYDEADKLLKTDFLEDVQHITSLAPKYCQKLLFSATLKKDFEFAPLVGMNNPSVFEFKKQEEELGEIELEQIELTLEEKGPRLRSILKEREFERVLIFTSSVYQADNVQKKLEKNGFNAKAIHSKKSQGARNTAIKEFKASEIPILVCTDLLARGIDIEDLPCVINYELPRSPKDFIHRIGRTGRAGKTGLAISFITEDDKHHYKVIEKKLRQFKEKS